MTKKLLLAMILAISGWNLAAQASNAICDACPATDEADDDDEDKKKKKRGS